MTPRLECQPLCEGPALELDKAESASGARRELVVPDRRLAAVQVVVYVDRVFGAEIAAPSQRALCAHAPDKIPDLARQVRQVTALQGFRVEQLIAGFEIHVDRVSDQMIRSCRGLHDGAVDLSARLARRGRDEDLEVTCRRELVQQVERWEEIGVCSQLGSDEVRVSVNPDVTDFGERLASDARGDARAGRHAPCPNRSASGACGAVGAGTRRRSGWGKQVFGRGLDEIGEHEALLAVARPDSEPGLFLEDLDARIASQAANYGTGLRRLPQRYPAAGDDRSLHMRLHGANTFSLWRTMGSGNRSRSRWPTVMSSGFLTLIQ